MTPKYIFATSRPQIMFALLSVSLLVEYFIFDYNNVLRGMSVGV